MYKLPFYFSCYQPDPGVLALISMVSKTRYKCSFRGKKNTKTSSASIKNFFLSSSFYFNLFNKYVSRVCCSCTFAGNTSCSSLVGSVRVHGESDKSRSRVIAPWLGREPVSGEARDGPSSS